MREYKAIIFDLDNTLYDEFNFFEKFVKHYINGHHVKRYLRKEFETFFKTHRNSSTDILGDILELYGVKNIKLNHDTLFSFFSKHSTPVSLYKGALSTLNYLKEKYVLGLLTNGTVDIQKNKVSCLGIEKLFNCIVYARTWGSKFEKPHELSFNKVVNELDVTFDECVFVGDNPKNDFHIPIYKGAYSIRIKRGLHKNVELNSVDKEIENIEELIHIL